MERLEVTEGHYYQEQYENNGYRITVGPTRGYLAWKSHEVVKAFNTLAEAEDFTNNN